MSHTPGPWTVVRDNGTCGVYSPAGNRIVTGQTLDDARLISAAPDLLEAAKGALQTLDRLPADTLAVPGISKHLRNAIAKAEGR